jgi:hypothetical protein
MRPVIHETARVDMKTIKSDHSIRFSQSDHHWSLTFEAYAMYRGIISQHTRMNDLGHSTINFFELRMRSRPMNHGINTYDFQYRPVANKWLMSNAWYEQNMIIVPSRHDRRKSLSQIF